MQIFIPDYVKEVINTIENNGGEAFLVGGCVRDSLLNITPDDYDIATSLLPEEILSLFDKTIATGIKHGTVTVVSNGKNIEVTTYRTDGAYNDSRHPENVLFVRNLKDDLSRRDFTVNALAYNERIGLVDLFGGVDDLKGKILRTVGNPADRFKEDKLRIMRLFRFSAQLGFSTEENTLNAALLLSEALSEISRERIAVELFKSLTSKYPERINPLLKTGALKFCGIDKCEVSNNLSKLPRERFIRFFSFVNFANLSYENICKQLKTDRVLLNYCTELNALLSVDILNSTDCKKALNRFSEKAVEDSLIIKNQSAEIVRTVIQSGEPYKTEHLSISGNDLSAIGLRGKKIGLMLSFLTDFVIENPAQNEKEKLIEIACNNK